MGLANGKYWIWQDYSTARNKVFVMKYDGLSDKNSRSILNGEKLLRMPKIIINDHTRGRFTDCIGCCQGFIVVSKELYNVMKKIENANLQFLPVSVMGNHKLKYFIVNVLDSVPTLDLNRSKIEKYHNTNVIHKILKFVLKPIPKNAPPIFHVKEQPPLIIVNDELKLLLTKISATSGNFIPVEKYKNGY